VVGVRIVCVGKLKETYFKQAAAEYEKMLGGFCALETAEVAPAPLGENPSPREIEAALLREAQGIAKKIPAATVCAVLCSEGEALSSGQFSDWLAGNIARGHGHFTFVIGGSNGLAERLKSDAALRLSMGPMTFPHRLARVMLLEQLYRAFSIAAGGKYHK